MVGKCLRYACKSGLSNRVAFFETWEKGTMISKVFADSGECTTGCH